MKRKILVVLIIISILVLSTNVYADSLTLDPIEQTLITPDVVEVCNGLPYHDMVSKAWGTAYIGTYPDRSNTWIGYGCRWQCSGCYKVMITENDHCWSVPVGKWATCELNYPVTGTWSEMFTYTYGTYNSTPFPGFRFR